MEKENKSSGCIKGWPVTFRAIRWVEWQGLFWLWLAGQMLLLEPVVSALRMVFQGGNLWLVRTT